MTQDLNALEVALNTRIQAGDVLGTLQDFYAEHMTMREGASSEATVGRQANHERLSAFLGSLTAFNGATLHAYAIGDGVTLSEWTFDMVGPEGPILWNEVIRRRWQDGKVVEEVYYTA